MEELVKFLEEVNAPFIVSIDGQTKEVKINCTCVKKEVRDESIVKIYSIEKKLEELGYSETYSYEPITISEGKTTYSIFKTYKIVK